MQYDLQTIVSAEITSVYEDNVNHSIDSAFQRNAWNKLRKQASKEMGIEIKLFPNSEVPLFFTPDRDN